MSLNQITFYKFKKDDMSGVESHNDFVDTTQLFLFPPNLFNIEAYEIDYYYTWVGGAEGDRYTPGTILDPEIDTMPEDGTEFYTAWKEGDRGYLALIYDDITIDISDLLLGANVTYGKNQPFPYGEVTISKQIFNSDDYWASRIEMSLYQGDATPITKKPVLKQGSTKVSIGVYGIEGEWEFQRVKDNETTYNLICVHPAHRLKNIALDSLFTLGPYTQTADDAYLSFPNLFGEEVFYFRKDGVLSPNCSYVSGTPPMWIVGGFMGSGVDLYVEVGVHKSPTVSKLTGPPSEIFKLLVHLGIGTSYSDMKVNLGTTHIDDDFTFSDTISSDDMDDLKEEQKSIVTNEYLINTSIRAQGNMWEVIQSLGYLANCEVFFYDKAYFVDYVTPNTSVDKLLLNYENVPADGWITEEVLNIVDNLDQGSQAIQTSQTVFSENYSISMAVEGSSRYLIEGKDVKHIYPDTPEEDYVKDRRNFQIKTIALNLLLKNYQPGDVVSYSLSEIKRADVLYDDEEEMEADLVNQSEGIIAQVGVGYFAEYYICTMVDGLTKAWVEFKFNVNPIRDGKYSIYSRANHIKDEQNDLELFDVPLALTTLSYPSCMTTYVWGNPEFLDTEQALKEVESGVADSTKTGTDDTVISDKYSAMMVYGNLGVSELPEDRDGFTGMILEKNWDKEMYRFVGYEDGKEQAMFDTNGKIVAGGGNTLLDEQGLTIVTEGATQSYDERSALKIRRTDMNSDSLRIYSVGNAGESTDTIIKATSFRPSIFVSTVGELPSSAMDYEIAEVGEDVFYIFKNNEWGLIENVSSLNNNLRFINESNVSLEPNELPLINSYVYQPTQSGHDIKTYYYETDDEVLPWEFNREKEGVDYYLSITSHKRKEVITDMSSSTFVNVMPSPILFYTPNKYGIYLPLYTNFNLPGASDWVFSINAYTSDSNVKIAMYLNNNPVPIASYNLTSTPTTYTFSVDLANPYVSELALFISNDSSTRFQVSMRHAKLNFVDFGPPPAEMALGPDNILFDVDRIDNTASSIKYTGSPTIEGTLNYASGSKIKMKSGATASFLSGSNLNGVYNTDSDCKNSMQYALWTRCTLSDLDLAPGTDYTAPSGRTTSGFRFIQPPYISSGVTSYSIIITRLNGTTDTLSFNQGFPLPPGWKFRFTRPNPQSNLTFKVWVLR